MVIKMTERERFIRALKREKVDGLVPHFELVFFLTMEAIGRVHPSHRNYFQWDQMSASEKKAQIHDQALCYTEIAEKYNHSAIFVHPNPGPIGEICYDTESIKAILSEIREISGDQYFLMIHGDPTFPIPDGNGIMEFTELMFEHHGVIHDESKRNVERQAALAKAFENTGLLDGFALCSDYCFNSNPFYSPELFDEFITPYLSGSIANNRSMGYYSIKHTDGNIMPILDRLVAAKPDALHSLDPQGGVSLTEVGERYGDKVCLIGNVNCGLLQTGTDGEVIADVKRSLAEGAKFPGYIFSTSNCAYTGLPLERYELMNKIWRNYEQH